MYVDVALPAALKDPVGTGDGWECAGLDDVDWMLFCTHAPPIGAGESLPRLTIGVTGAEGGDEDLAIAVGLDTADDDFEPPEPIDIPVEVANVAPSPPTSVKATAGNRSARLEWSGASGNGLPIQSYKITASPGGATKTVSGTSTVFNGLSNGTKYTFSVRATSVAGTSASKVSNAVTPRAAPGKPTSVRASTSAATVTVTWGSAPSNGATITNYQVVASSGNRTITTTGARKARFSNLAPGSYRFRVRAKNAAGWGTFSSFSAAVAVAPSYVTRFTEGEWASVTTAARFFGVNPKDLPKTGVAVLRYILALSGSPAPRPAARPLNTGPRVVTTTYSPSVKASTLDPVARYLALGPGDTLKIGAALMQYLAAVSGAR